MRMAPIEEALGNPTNPAYIPNLMLDLGPEMDFRERLLNTLFHTAMKIGTDWFSLDYMEKMVKEATGIEEDLNLRELTLKASFSLTNRDKQGARLIYILVFCSYRTGTVRH